MREQEFNERWLDRSARYPGGGAFPIDCPVHISIDPRFGSTYAGQVAAVTAASLFGRMTRRVGFDVAPLPIDSALPWSGATLDDVVERTLAGCHQYGQYERRSASDGDVRLIVGRSGRGLVMHGSGWDAYCGTDPSPLEQTQETNPFGAAFSVIRAAAELQRNPRLDAVRSWVTDTYHWRDEMPRFGGAIVTPDFQIGELWSVGVGSVGSCALFFLSLITRAYQAVLIDKDKVEIENVTRSALFSWGDGLAEPFKVDAVGKWLRTAGVHHVESHSAWLDQIPERWAQREVGTPDIVIAAANERNARSLIETNVPPLQVYATTGRNWQATLFRHVPIKEACSGCVPGAKVTSSAALCATGARDPSRSDEHDDDVALPFLSYAAGLMTAAEIAKIAITGEPITANRVFFEPANRGIFAVALGKRPGCACAHRNPDVHRAAIAGSRFAALSEM